MVRYFRPVILLLFLLPIQKLAVAQNDTTRINTLIDSLSWNSVAMTCMATVIVLTHSDSTEQELVRIGKPATGKLVAALSDSRKTVIAHIILTEIWGEKSANHFFSTKYIYRNCNQLVGWHYIHNGLVWEWYSGSGDSIRPAEVEKIKQYWKEKALEGKDVAIDIGRVDRELDRQDELDYPCNKVYDNNSRGVRYNELYQLLGKKSDIAAFSTLWNRFGNDSTVRVFDDCFFITYGPEGLSFRFETDSTLSTIFVEGPYQGELPYKLKLTDLKPVAEKKTGPPFKSGSYSNYTWGWYKDKHLYLDFNEKGKIVKFAISKN